MRSMSVLGNLFYSFLLLHLALILLFSYKVHSEDLNKPANVIRNTLSRSENPGNHAINNVISKENVRSFPDVDIHDEVHYYDEFLVDIDKCDPSEGYNCRGPDWDLNAEDTFQLNVYDIQILSEDIGDVVPNNINWAFPLAKMAKLARIAFAMPFGIIASKLAKPFAWKLAVAAKLGFLKLVFLKKLLSVKSRLGGILLSKAALLILPGLLAPVLKGLGFLKFFDIGLIGGLKNIDCMLSTEASCESSISRDESLSLHFLPWFAQPRAKVGRSSNPFKSIVGALLDQPRDEVESLSVPNPSTIADSDGKPLDYADILDSIGNPTIRNLIYESLNDGNDNMFQYTSHNLRSIDGRALSPIGNEVDQVISNVMSMVIGGFGAAVQSLQDTRLEYEHFMDYASTDKTANLTKRTFLEELEYRLPLPTSTMKILKDKIYIDEQVPNRVDKEQSNQITVDDVDNALRSLVQCILLPTKDEFSE